MGCTDRDAWQSRSAVDGLPGRRWSQVAPERRANRAGSCTRKGSGQGNLLDVDVWHCIITGSLSATVDPPVAAGNGEPWRPFIPASYGAHGHLVLNARNALDSRRTGERGGGQHPATSGLWRDARMIAPEGPLEPCCTAAQRQCSQVSVQFALVCARHSDGGQRAQPRKARENALASLYCRAVAMSATGRLVLRRSCRASAYRRRFKSV